MKTVFLTSIILPFSYQLIPAEKFMRFQIHRCTGRRSGSNLANLIFPFSLIFA
jgi:hypothetical protein